MTTHLTLQPADTPATNLLSTEAAGRLARALYWAAASLAAATLGLAAVVLGWL